MSERPDEPRDLLDSDANVGEADGLAGTMGVSSERVGKVRGSSGLRTHGTEDTSKTTSSEQNSTEGLSADDSGKI